MSGVYEKVWNFEHLIYSDQRWFPPNFRIFGCLWSILAQSNGPFKVRKFNIPFGMYLVHTITTYRLKMVPNTTHTITVCTRYLPGTYHVHTWYANFVRALILCQISLLIKPVMIKLQFCALHYYFVHYIIWNLTRYVNRCWSIQM